MIRKGYGQVEPNHLSAQRTGQIYAQLPAASGIEQLENGQFAKYDYANGEVNLTAENQEWLLVFNEVKHIKIMLCLLLTQLKEKLYQDFSKQILVIYSQQTALIKHVLQEMPKLK